MLPEERPQERLEALGAGALTDKELLAMMLRSGQKGMDVLAVAESLLSAAGSLYTLLGWTREDFEDIKGIGKVKALQLVSLMEISKRTLLENQDPAPMLDSPEAVSRFLRARAHGLEIEKFWALNLNRKNRLLRCVEVTSGTATASLVHPREVFRAAIRSGASALIVAHNHPSGDPAPSRADIQVTRQLREAAKVVAIDLLDHVVIGKPGADPQSLGYYSFNDAGLI